MTETTFLTDGDSKIEKKVKPKLEIVNIDSLLEQEEGEAKTDEPLFVRVGHKMFVTFSSKLNVKMLAYKYAGVNTADDRGKLKVDDYGSVFSFGYQYGKAMTRPEIKFAMIINGDPTEQRTITNDLMKEYFIDDENRKKQSSPAQA